MGCDCSVDNMTSQASKPKYPRQLTLPPHGDGHQGEARRIGFGMPTRPSRRPTPESGIPASTKSSGRSARGCDDHLGRSINGPPPRD